MNPAGTASSILFNEELSNGQKWYGIKLVLPLSHFRNSYPITVRFLEILSVILKSVNNSISYVKENLNYRLCFKVLDPHSCQWLEWANIPIFQSQPASLDSPEAGHKPMQIDTCPFSSAEGQCWRTLYLCLYYRVGRHVESTCPIKLPQALVSFITS